MTDDKQYCDGNGYCLKRLSTPSPDLKADNAALREALAEMIYETTHLSPCRPNGDHQCIITAATLARARAALQATEPRP